MSLQKKRVPLEEKQRQKKQLKQYACIRLERLQQQKLNNYQGYPPLPYIEL